MIKTYFFYMKYIIYGGGKRIMYSRLCIMPDPGDSTPGSGKAIKLQPERTARSPRNETDRSTDPSGS